MLVHPVLLQCQAGGGGTVGLSIQLVETSSPVGTDYALEEAIAYDAVWQNTGGVTLYNLSFERDRTGDIWNVATLSAGASGSLAGSTSVTEADILNGYISEVLRVTYEDSDGNQYSAYGTITFSNIDAPDGQIIVSVAASPSGTVYRNTQVPYAITVTNTGNLTISNISVLNTDGSARTVASLAPSQSFVFSSNVYHIVTAEEAADGSAVVSATATGLSPDTNASTVTASGSASISVTYSLDFQIKTDASGIKRGAIPYNLSSAPSGTTMTVDWGDGTTSNLTSASYGSNYSDALASIHEYTNHGTYNVRVTYNGDWSANGLSWWATSTKMTTSYNARTEFLYVFQQNLYKVLSALPPFTIVRYYSQVAPTGSPSTKSGGITHAFRFCANLVSVPECLFKKLGSATDSSYIFYGCSNLFSATGYPPANLLKPLTLTTTFNSAFYQCTSLAGIPSGFFDANTKVTSFASIFYGCTALEDIPAKLFDKNTLVTSFNNLFYGCTTLPSVPAGLFDKNTRVSNMAQMFYNNYALASIPVDLFRYNTSVTNFSYLCRSCNALTTLPTNIFKYNTAVTNFKSTFYSCTNLGDFAIHIGATGVASGNAANFVSKKTGATRTVYVPSNSTTQSTFNAVASSLGLTVVGE